MQIQTLSLDDAKSLCIREEGHFFDRKAKEIRPARIEKIAVAYANADGGEVVIGIADEVDKEDPTAAWQGGENPEEFNAVVQALYALTPSLPVYMRFYAAEGLSGIVLSVVIEKSNKVHRASDGTVYVRRNAASVPVADPAKIKELEYSKGIVSFEEEKVPSVEAESLVESAAIRDFLKSFSPRTDPLSYAINEYLLDRKTWEPKYAGILLFHDTPASALPRKSSVKIVRYETSQHDPERENLKDVHTIEGPLYELIQRSIEKITGILTDVNVWTMAGMKKVSYPPETLMEIFVNAVIHRDYSISDDVQVFIFDNRIEVKSPGRLPGHITPENILSERFTRNTKIVRTLARYPNAPNKDIGEGLDTAFQKMKDWKLKAPVIEQNDNSVLVTVPHTPLARPEELVLEFLRAHGRITNKQARDITGIKDTNNMKAVFYRLRDNDQIEAIPELKGPAAAWRLKT